MHDVMGGVVSDVLSNDLLFESSTEPLEIVMEDVSTENTGPPEVPLTPPSQNLDWSFSNPPNIKRQHAFYKQTHNKRRKGELPIPFNLDG